MLRPKRAKKKTSDGVIKTSLSKPADGSALRRRYALAGAGFVVMLIAVIVVLVTKGGKSDPADTSFDIEVDMSKFEELHDYDLPNQKLKAKIYKHKKSDLQVMAVYPEDTSGDAVFGLNIRTVPHNNHGTPHVLQRAVFNGSQKYPVKDPFNQLKHGSLQSYIDAWTGRDRSAFVVASRNLKDFRNSIDVFLDSVFNPRVIDQKEASWIFRQEAWRVEVEVEGDQQKAVLNGNALQEARASQMLPHDNMMNYIYSKLFPDTSYKFVPTGTSDKIVNMDIDELVSFHKMFYHPANSQAFCYGADDYVRNCLAGLQVYLDQFQGEKESIREASEVEWQDIKAISKQDERIPYASLTDNQDYRIAISWVLNDEPMDARTEVAWLLLEEVLIGTRTSLMSKRIHDLDIGDDIVGGLDHSVQQWIMTIGVNGLASEDQAVNARNEITDKLLRISEDGINEEALQAAANKVEYRLLEQSGRGGAPRGVTLFYDVIDKWTYDRDPTLNLRYSTAFAELKEEIKNSGASFLVDLITQKLIDNEHKVNLELYPSTDEAQRLFNLENVFLQQTSADLGQQGSLDLVKESQDLKRRQQEEETEAALATIPRVSLSDIRKTPYEISPKIDRDVENSGVTIVETEVASSNGIGYVDFAIDISTMDFDHIVYLPLFCRLIQEGGKKSQSDVKFQRRVDTSTGGIWVTPLVEDIVAKSSDNGIVVPTGEHFVSKIVIRGSAVAARGSLELMNVFKTALFDTNFEGEETKRIVRQMLRQMIDDVDDDVLVNGHTYTTQRIASKYSLPQYVNEQLYGVTQLMNMRRILNLANNDWDALQLTLLQMNDKLKNVSRTGMTISVSGDRTALKDMAPACRVFVRDLLPEVRGIPNLQDFATSKHPWVTPGTNRMKNSMKTEDVDEAFVIPTRVSHVGKGGQIYEEGERINGYDLVTLKYLGGFFLFYQLKYTQGAKEAQANLDLDSGVLIYQSDRDPSIIETLDVYEHAAEFIMSGVATYNKLPVDAAAAIVGTVGWMDGPALQPNSVGYTALVQYLKQETSEVRQIWRDEILSTKRQDFLDMAERLGAWGKNSISVVTSEEQLEKATLRGLNATVCNFQGYVC